MARRKAVKKGRVSRSAPRTAKQKAARITEALLTRDEWLHLAAQGAQLGLWYWNEVTQRLFCDRKTREIFGVNPEGEVTLETFWNAMHPDDVARVQRVWREELLSGVPYELDYRARWRDGSVRWINAKGKGFYDKAGRPLYMIGVVFDITERMESERERIELSGRLINAQERERKHLAREIHDDFCQRFAVLSLKLQTLAETIQDEQSTAMLKDVTGTFADLGNDLQKFSHRLHSAKLEILGLTGSLESLCAEISRDYGIHVEFDHTQIPAHPSPELSLCLFRIAQEGLHNIVKHSGASRVEVRLKGDSGVMALSVFDNGRGLDPSSQASSDGIGIRSMKERARMLDGRFEILSRPLVEGTRIDVTIPLR